MVCSAGSGGGAAALEQGGEELVPDERLLAGEGVPLVAVDAGERVDYFQALRTHGLEYNQPSLKGTAK